MKKNIVKHTLFILIILIMSVPLIQKTYTFLPEANPLIGATIENKDTSLTIDTWISGDYQKKKEAFMDQNFGERNLIVRLNNQIRFTLFKQSNVKELIIGNKNYLFQKNYLNALYGNDFVGEAIIKERLRKFKLVQDTLEKLGIPCELIIAPSKARYYQEYIPKENKQTITSKTNYFTVLKECKANNINYFDVSDWFLKIKHSHGYPLFPKTGVHWNNYGSVLFVDSLMKRLEYKSKLNLPKLHITSVNISNNLVDVDQDLGNTMNLIKPIQVEPMPYPTYSWEKDSSKAKIDALFVADSYLWNIYYQGLTVNLFSNITYNYYNTTIYNDRTPEPTGKVDVTKTKEVIEKHKAVIILLSEPNLQDLGWGFIDWAYDGYFIKKN